MEINHISVSRKKCFATCSQQYKYRYHMRLPSPVPEPVYFWYGNVVHKIAEEYVRNQGKITIGEIAKEVICGNIEIGEGKKCPPIPADYTKKLQKHLKSILELTKKIGMDGMVEYEFRYDLDPPNNRFTTGFLDRLIIRGDKAYIIDYKTTKKGKWRVNKQTVVDDLQLRMYARVVQRNFGIKAENIKAALFYLEGEELVGCCYSEESLIKVEQELLDTYLMIEKSDPDKAWGKVGWHCKNCDYATLCPFYTSSSMDGSSIAWDGDMGSV